MRRIVLFLPLAIFSLVTIAFVFGLDRDPARIPSVLIDRPLPRFDLPAVRVADVGLGSRNFRGKPMLLNIFASWCVSCRIEHPLLMELRGQGVPIAGIDWKDKAADGARYLMDNGDPYVRAGVDVSGRTGIDLGVTGVPETFIVDGRGLVRFKQIGPIEPRDWANTIKPLMNRLAAER